MIICNFYTKHHKLQFVISPRRTLRVGKWVIKQGTLILLIKYRSMGAIFSRRQIITSCLLTASTQLLKISVITQQYVSINNDMTSCIWAVTFMVHLWHMMLSLRYFIMKNHPPKSHYQFKWTTKSFILTSSILDARRSLPY